MKIIDILKFNRELIKRLRETGIRLEDERYIDLYNDYTKGKWRKSILYRSRAL